MKFYREHFGKKLKDALDNAGLKQYQFADKMAVEPPTVSRWIRGLDFPSEKYIKTMCDTLGVSIEYFGYNQSEMSAAQLIELLVESKEILPKIAKIPKEVLDLLSNQDSKYFESLFRTLKSIEEKKNSPVKSKVNIS